MSEAERVTKVVNVHSQPVSVRILRDSKGAYRWEIEVYAEDESKALAMVNALDSKLRAMFLEAEAPKPLLAVSGEKLAGTAEQSPSISVKDGGIEVAEIVASGKDTRIEFSKELRISPEHPAIKSFLLGKYLKPMAEEQGLSIALDVEDGALKAVKISPCLKRINVDEMEKKILWAIRKSSGSSSGGAGSQGMEGSRNG